MQRHITCNEIVHVHNLKVQFYRNFNDGGISLIRKEYISLKSMPVI